MKNTKLLLAIAASAALLTGCQNTHGIDTNMAICNFAFFSGLIDAQFWTACATQKSPELTTNNN